MGDHYFSSQPASPAAERTVQVSLGGHRLTVSTAAGVFSPDGVDRGTRVLLDHVQTPPPGTLVDLGCGWGPLTVTAALVQPDLHVVAVDVNERSRDLTQRNAQRALTLRPGATVEVIDPSQMPDDFTFDTLWSNPPIRVGKAQLHAMLSQWLPRLRAGGHGWLVVAKHLGADSLARWMGDQATGDQPWGEVERVATDKGFRVLRLTRAG